jgi:hypothetical protein
MINQFGKKLQKKPYKKRCMDSCQNNLLPWQQGKVLLSYTSLINYVRKNRSFSTFAISSKIHEKITQIIFMVSIKQKKQW